LYIASLPLSLVPTRIHGYDLLLNLSVTDY
jgi:hypothetical protein